METERKCYGALFPPIVKPPQNVNVAGRVLSYRIEPPGSVPTGHTLSVDRESWRHCLECKDFESCYRLSIAKLLVDSALPA